MKVVIKSTVALTAAHAVGYSISLAEVPILARALGPQAYGELLWVQMTALLISMLVDYGFTLSASRQVAQARSNPNKLKTIVGNVFLAKVILLATVAVPMVLLYVLFKPVDLALAFAGFIYMTAFGMSPFWYFQGMEKMGRAVTIEIITRTAALLGLLMLVKEPADAPLALWLMASGGLVCSAITSWICLREVAQVQASISRVLSHKSKTVHRSSSTKVAPTSSQLQRPAY